MYKISVEREFDMAHIVETNTKCGRMHGHRWKIVVEIEGNQLKNGMIIDFIELKKFIDKIITNEFDHRLFISERFIKRIDNEYVEFEINNKSYKVPVEDTTVYNIDNATSECLVKLFYDMLNDEWIFNNTKISKIRLYETPTAYAEYSGD